MLYYDRINISEENYVKKTSASKVGNICHYSYFLDEGFKFQPYVCNWFHDVWMISANLNDIHILNINGGD